MHITAWRSALLLLTTLVCCQAADSAGRPPNLIVILADDLGWADLGCYGSQFYQTPRLDRMAREGIRFTDAYAASTVCSPSRAALMTGKFPARLHLTDFIPGRAIKSDQKLRRPDFEQNLPLRELTLAERLKSNGYQSGFFGKWHLGGIGFHASDQGFDVATPEMAGMRRTVPLSTPSPNSPALVEPLPGEELTSVLTRSAIRFIEQNRDHPFLLYLPHVAVHIPLHGRNELIQKYQKLAQAGARQTNAVYAAMLESLDEGVGAILDALERLHLTQNTLVIFTSDNGGLNVLEGANTPATSNAPLRAGKGFVYEGGIRVPLIAWWPGTITGGRVDSTPLITMDLHATLAALGGVSSPGEGLDGHSFAGLLRGQSGPEAHSLFWHYPHYSNQGGTPASAMREGDFKLIEFLESGHLELYDLSKDPAETRDLAGEMAERANAMAKQLADWRRSVQAQMPTANTNYLPTGIAPSADGSVVLPAHEASTHGVNLRYEPPAHKNTLGYWTKREDWASWTVRIPEPRAYTVEVLQGCGKGSGGSEVEVSIGDQKVRFIVEDTGHFQHFIRRQIGVVTLPAGKQTLVVKPVTKPGVAVMDLREVVLRAETTQK